jgi:Tol biopolymer transport system component
MRLAALVLGGMLVATCSAAASPTAAPRPRRPLVRSDLTAPAWSPTANQIAYARVGPRASAPGIYLGDRRFAPFYGTVRADDDFASSEYLWSPDGSRLAYRNGTFAFVVRRADGAGSSTLLARAGDEADWFSWSPDSTKLAYVANARIWTVDVGGRRELITDPHEEPNGWTFGLALQETAWAPDGKTIAYAGVAYHPGYSVFHTPASIYVAYVASKTLDLFPAPSIEGTSCCPAWSRDGRLASVVWEHWDDDLTPVPDLVVEQWVAPVHVRNPTWSSAGLIAANADDDKFVVVLEPGRGERWRARGHAQVWSPDGRRLAFVRDGFVRVRLADGRGERTYGRGSDVSWSPTSDRFAYLRRGCTGRPGIYVASLAGSTTQLAAPRACRMQARGGRVEGSSLPDFVAGDTQLSDTIDTGLGDDTIMVWDARDGGRASRDTVRCGSGRDKVIADRVDRVAADRESVSYPG